MIEVLRYPHYAMSIVGRSPRWLAWLRYSGFVPLYPLGFAMEALLLHWAKGIAHERGGLHSLRMPNTLNFSFDYTPMLELMPLVYPPVFVTLYGHMLSQRRKKLSPPKERFE